jgi:hypothetical protein
MTNARYLLYRAIKVVQGGGPESLKLEARGLRPKARSLKPRVDMT